MPINKDFYTRLEILDQCLRNHYRTWTLEQLIDCVCEKYKEVSRKTIQNDLKYLKDNLRAPLIKKRLGNEVFFSYETSNFSIKNQLLSEEEINYLKSAVDILRNVNQFKILKDVDDVIKRLQNTIDTSAEGNECFIQFEKNTVAQGSEYIDDLFFATKSKQPLRICYQSFKASSEAWLDVHPYLIKEYRNRWFLLGRISGNNYVTTLALDRIKSIKNSSAAFVENDLFDPATYFDHMIGVTIPSGKIVEEIKLLVDSRQAPYIKTKPIHNTQVDRELEDGRLEVTLQLVINYELQSVLLSYGADIEVITPTSLRQELKEVYRSAVELYNSFSECK